MAENPLLPNDRLRALLALTKECARLEAAAARSLDSGAGAKRGKNRVGAWPSREALIAGTILQLEPGDVLLANPSDRIALQLLPKLASGEDASPATPPFLDKVLGGQAPRLLLGAAMAAASRAGGTDRLVMVYLDTSAPQANWAAALRWAQERLLPLIVICGDARGTGSFRSSKREDQATPSWAAVQDAAAKLQLPVLSVDGEDAVAVYRVMQESVLRARSGAGPALIWAMLPSVRELDERTAATRPVARLQRYLRARKIPAQAP